MTEITDDLPARLLHEENAGWRAILEGRAGQYYAREMTSDGVMVVPGAVLTRDQVRQSFEGVPRWEEYEIHEPRVVRLDDAGGILVYRAVARRGGGAVELLMSTTYVFEDGGWKIAAHQQTPV